MILSEESAIKLQKIIKFQKLHALIELRKSIKELYAKNNLNIGTYYDLLKRLSSDYESIIFNLTEEESKYYIKDSSLLSCSDFNDFDDF